MLTRQAMAKLSREDLEDYAINNDTEILTKLSEVQKEVASFQNELKHVNDRFIAVESELAITKRVNMELVKRINDLEYRMTAAERKGYSNEQYSRKECIEVAGIPSNIAHEDLEGTIIKLLAKINCHVSVKEIEACHRISKKTDNVILKFSRRKDSDFALKWKKKLMDADLTDIGINGKVYINESLSPMNKSLRYKCKKLWEVDLLFGFWSYGGKVFMRLEEYGDRYEINHVNDIEKHFPDTDLFALYEQKNPPKKKKSQ